MIESINAILASNFVVLTYWVLACVGSFFFGIMFLFAIFGLDGDSDVDSGDIAIDHVDTGFLDIKIFSIRSLFAFIMFFGWGGVLFSGLSPFPRFFCALGLGILMMIITSLILLLFLKMQESGNINDESFIGKRGTVYITIPSGRIESGKVTIMVGTCTRELMAIADEQIESGTTIEVKEKIDGIRYLVQKV